MTNASISFPPSDSMLFRAASATAPPLAIASNSFGSAAVSPTLPNARTAARQTSSLVLASGQGRAGQLAVAANANRRQESDLTFDWQLVDIGGYHSQLVGREIAQRRQRRRA